MYMSYNVACRHCVPIWTTTRMWANAQRDGRPAKYRWGPLFNAAKFGWRPLLECHAVTLPRRESHWNWKGCPKLANKSQPLETKVHHIMRTCGGVFSYCRYMPQLQRYSPTKLCDGAKMAIFLRPAFSASSVQHIWDMHSKFALRPHQVWKYGRHPISDRWQ